MRIVIAVPVVLALSCLPACDYPPIPPTGPTTVTQTVTTTVSNTPVPPATPVPTPTPGGGPTGTNRTPDPAGGGTLPLPVYGQSVLQVYAASATGAAALQTACPTSAGASWAFMDGLVDQLRQRDQRWGYLCRRGNCQDPSNDVVGYHATAGPDITGAAGVIGVDVIGDLCGGNVAQWLPSAFDAAALWTSRGRF